MRRHWQHTSFCMGQCVSSCGSKRTLDSVPTTPDTDNYPGLVPLSKTFISENNTKRQFPLSAPPASSQGQDWDSLSRYHQKPKTPANKFVTAFSQRRIATSRINPEEESPARIRKSPGSPALSFNITSSPSPDLGAPRKSVHHGDMRESKSKNYFRETISSAKKSSTKSVTFSEKSPSPANAPKKKSFFSFSNKNFTAKHSKKETFEEQNQSSSPSPGLSKLFGRKSKSKGPQIVRPPKEKQVARVTLSPKHSLTRVELLRGESKENSQFEKERYIQQNEFLDKIDPRTSVPAGCGDQQEMGNATSSSQGHVVEALKTISSSVKPISALDCNKNNTSKSGGKSVASSPGLSRKNSFNRRLPLSKNNDLENNTVSRNLNSLKEENRRARLKFFLQDAENLNYPAEAIKTSVAAGDTCLTAVDSVTKMNRQNMIGSSVKSSQLPKPMSAKSYIPTSGIPKLYSVPIMEHDNAAQQSTTGVGATSRLKFNPRVVADPVQPSNLNNGPWLPAEDFFVQPSDEAAGKSSVSPPTAKTSRRSSEPPRYTGSGSNLHSKAVLHHNQPQQRGSKCPELTSQRRDTLYGYNNHNRKLTSIPQTSTTSIPTKSSGTSLAGDKNAVAKGVASRTTTVVRKPEETKPFYTLGLYPYRGKTAETGKTFGIHQSGFSGVSTGVVRQRMQQYQSKVSTAAAVAETNMSQVPPPRFQSTAKLDKKKEEKSSTTCHGASETVSPRKTGVVRSATYTIRKHGLGEGLKSKTDVDPKYLTYTRKKTGPKEPSQVILNSAHNEEHDEGPHSFEDGSLLNQSGGYPLQHNVSGTSTSSMGTNEDAIGDHVVISDSEYLIDDEISDQPDLTLTFKDSSLKLSASSSGESLLSDIMLDNLDINQDRILGELTSDSAISDISTHKPKSKSSSEQLHKPFESVKSRSFDQPCSKLLESSPSHCDMASPSSVRTVRYLKSPRRVSRPAAAVSTSQLQISLDSNSSCRVLGHSVNTKSPSSSSLTTLKPRTFTPDKKQLPVRSPSQTKSSLQSTTTATTTMSPRHRQPSAKENVALTVENVNKLHKQYQLAASQCSFADGSNSLPSVLTDELLSEFGVVKDELEKLRLQLELQEQRERNKDELILRLTSEVNRLKTIVKGDMALSFKDSSPDLYSPKLDSGGGSPLDKEKYIDSRNYENAAVQTENNNIFNRSVTYPEDDDKYGELVRIGRSSSLKKKL